MKELKNAFLNVLTVQIILWILFLFMDEVLFFDSEMISLIFGIVFLVILLVLYFIYNKKIINKNNLRSFRFKVFEYIFWILFSFINYFFTIFLIDFKLIHVCNSTGWDCFLNGIEYPVYAFYMLIFIGLIIFIEIIIYIIKKIKEKFK